MNQIAPIYSLTRKRVWVAGHGGMVGSALMRRLQQEDCTFLTASRQELDLTRQRAVEEWLEEWRPQVVFLAAAKVGGIAANMSKPVDFLYDNLAIASNVIHTAAATGVEKLLFLGSSCIYPKFADQPIVEGELLNGPLEPTNEWYAVAKIAGLKLCRLSTAGLRLHLGGANQSIRAPRQFRSHHQPRDPGAHPQGARSEGVRQSDACGVGVRVSAPRVSSRGGRR
jgi:hypothetical protein